MIETENMRFIHKRAKRMAMFRVAQSSSSIQRQKREFGLQVHRAVYFLVADVPITAAIMTPITIRMMTIIQHCFFLHSQ
jgi:hypothetical protein